ncbi:TlpA disulfide reductase family protein [Asticcacaulis sp. 201]|uniref:TlpA family protein disulfide reductase n=1 Tax=Asticcacaulis sp. 201 TaxID=3028787 RepID=UPI0029167864|nr:TlpA disulfide reductase family protein [Asticcacaulis sp. 201]MDV6331769.1 TlpA disulfide reductase family protein [Asticcacaulis sp. 201]
MTEPELNRDDAQKPASMGTDVQGQTAVTPIVKPIDDDTRQPKGIQAGIIRKKRAVPVAVVVVVTVVLAIIIALVAWRLIVPMIATQTPEAPLPTLAGPTAAIPQAKGPLAVYAKGPLAKMATYETPQVIEDISFIDRDKKPVHLSDFKGQVVVLNVWATWCAPCRFEMPTLAHLQTLYTGKGVKVLPLSVDTEQQFADVKSFMDVQQPLEVYADQNFQAPSKYKISGMPGTLILDKQGRMVARLDGEAKWDTPEVQALLDKLLAE